MGWDFSDCSWREAARTARLDPVPKFTSALYYRGRIHTHVSACGSTQPNVNLGDWVEGSMRDAGKPRCHICRETSSSLLVGFKMQHRPVRPCALCRRVICEREVVHYPTGNGRLKVIGCRSCAVVPASRSRKKRSKASQLKKRSVRRPL